MTMNPCKHFIAIFRLIVRRICFFSAVDSVILESVGLTVKSSDKKFYNTVIVDELCKILVSSTAQGKSIGFQLEFFLNFF